jgi:hypothetical protein
MAKDFNYKGINYTSFDGKTCSVKSSLDDDIANDVTGDVVIPPFVFDEDSNKYVVTAIGEGGFFSIKGGPTSVSITVAVKTIGESAFEQCSNLNYVYLPEELTEIKPFTFHGCDSLPEIELPETLEVIGENAFAFCGLRSLKLPTTLKLIEDNAFMKCEHISFVGIPNSVVAIGEKAFYGCCNVTSAIIGESVELIGAKAFDGSTSLHKVTCFNSVPPKPYLGDKIFSKETYEKGILCVLNGSIKAYSEAPGWKEFKHIESIGGTCDGGVFIYKGIAYTRTSEMTCCTRRTGGLWDIKPGNEAQGKIVIPQIAYDEYGTAFKVEEIGKHGFYNQTKLESVTFPESIKEIGDRAFYKCDGLRSVQLPESVARICANAFFYCANLSAVTIIGPIKTIDDYAFARCGKLSVITMLNSVETIGSCAFKEANLRAIFMHCGTPPVVSDTAFDESTYKNAILYVPSKSVAIYSSTPIWRLFNHIIAID